jgi:glc operon protein GlcG
MNILRSAGLSMAALLIAAPVFAADPPAAPAQDMISQPVQQDGSPFLVPYGMPIKLADARKVLSKAQGEAIKHHWFLACAVVEPTGELVAFEKMDDTQYASVEISIAKAKAAARFRRSIKVFFDVVKGGNPSVMSYPGVIAGEGAFPILSGGKLIGAIGCSGGASNQDATAALAGVEEIK